ncbi:hypothetical protein G6514_003146 [Epicoccum nigrum]|nr:hypothetical protein G6514_003146 [Epicoccum nigrum]
MAGRELSNGMLNSRASAGSPTAEEPEDIDDSDLEVELVGMPMESCDAVRRKIRAFLDNGEMKVGEFQNAISTNSKAYSNFMTQNGPSKGFGSSVYQKAWRFFKLRELRGIKPPKQPSKPKKGEEGAAAAAAAPDLTAIELPGEMDDKVAVYDTCDDIRRKINAHMKKPGVVQAQFLRDIAASYRKAPRKVQSTQLSKFRSKKGAWQGNTSVVFYGAYVFFEKMRIAEKKPKSKKRLEMEGIYSKEGGVDTKSRHEYFTILKGQRAHLDPYGRVDIFGYG